MVSQIPNIIEFTNKLSSNNKFKFYEKSERIIYRISPYTTGNKLSLHERFKQNSTQYYWIPDREIPMEALIRGFYSSLGMNLVKGILTCRGLLSEKYLR